MLYADFQTALRELNGQETAESEDQAKVLKERLWMVSRRIDLEMNPDRGIYFAPTIGTRRLPLNESRMLYQGTVFKPLFPLLEVSAVGLNYKGQSHDYTASVAVQDSKLAWIGSGAGFMELYHVYRNTAQIVITGTWGCHNDYANAWLTTDTITAAIASTTATGITVGNVDAADPRHIGERYSYGTLIKIDDEMMLVLEMNTSTNELTVQRGVNGSTAATHLVNRPVEIFQVEDPIRRVAARQAALLYARRGAFEAQQVDGFGVTTYPQDLLMELRVTLGRYQYA